MAALGEYVLSVAAASLICGILLGMFPDGAAKGLLQLVCGVVLLLAVMGSLTDLTVPDISKWGREYLEEGEYFAAKGEEAAQKGRRERIKSFAESYILDKAAELGLTVEAEVLLDDSGAPVAVTLCGEGSPYAKLQLTEIIAQDLGITKENLQWTTAN